MSIDRSETKRKQRGKCHGTHPMGVDVFRWSLRNEMNKTNIDGVITKFYYSTKGWGGQSDTLLVPKCKRAPNKLEGRDCCEKSDQPSLGAKGQAG